MLHLYKFSFCSSNDTIHFHTLLLGYVFILYNFIHSVHGIVCCFLTDSLRFVTLRLHYDYILRMYIKIRLLRYAFVRYDTFRFSMIIRYFLDDTLLSGYVSITLDTLFLLRLVTFSNCQVR